MSTAPRYIPHYTVADYRQWPGDWQLIDGIPIAMTPSPFGKHERIVANLVFEFMLAIDRQKCSCRVYAGLDWIVSNDTVVRPDVMVVCGGQPERHLERTPELVVEVLSPSTAEQDQPTKRQLYLERGVAAYVIVDPDGESIDVLIRGDGPQWRSEQSEAPTVRLVDGCELTVVSERVLR